MDELSPALDLLTRNAIAVFIAMPALVFVTQLGVAAILHITNRIL